MGGCVDELDSDFEFDINSAQGSPKIQVLSPKILVLGPKIQVLGPKIQVTIFFYFIFG